MAARAGVGRAILLGGIIVGALDAIDAVVFFGLRSRVRPIRIFQSIASGVLGRSAFQGGLRAAIIGVLLHFFIATIIVAVYVMASRVMPLLARRIVLFGTLYGLVAYAVMNLVVLPLSAATRGAYPVPVLANGILIHMFGVGLPSAWSARRAQAAGVRRE